MRSVVVDHARTKGAEKRGGNANQVLLDEALAIFETRVVDVVALHDALVELGKLDERMAQVVELRFFGGLEIAEVARVLDVGHATVERDWRSARAWLRGHLDDER